MQIIFIKNIFEKREILIYQLLVNGIHSNMSRAITYSQR